MVMHARSGGRLEVMGLMLGKIDGSTMVVMDTFALPVEGTETRVNAQAAAYEYMSTYIESAKQVREKDDFVQYRPCLDRTKMILTPCCTVELSTPSLPPSLSLSLSLSLDS